MGKILKEQNNNKKNYNISQNTEKSPGDLRRLVVTKMPVENHWLMLMRKTLGEKNDKTKRKVSTSTLSENLKNLWNMKVMVEPGVIGALGTVTKGLVQGLLDWK